MIAEDLDVGFEDAVAFIAHHTKELEPERDMGLVKTQRKSASIKRPSTPSIVAQAWKKQSGSDPSFDQTPG